MIIKNSQQDIEITIPANVKRVGLKISGGADSGITGYILSKYVSEERPDIRIVPITVDQAGKAFQIKFAKRIIEFYKKEFGDIFSEHVTDISGVGSDFVNRQHILVTRLYKNNTIQCHFVGLTRNPESKYIPQKIREVYQEPSGRARQDILRPTVTGGSYKPLINIDKKGVAELYQKFGLMDTLFPLTRSCEKYTDDFEKHCQECWFCAERYYGFGRYE